MSCAAAIRCRRVVSRGRSFLLLAVGLAWAFMFGAGEGFWAYGSSPQGDVYVISIEGSINPASDDFLKSSVRRAEAAGARLLVVRLNTPGGLITSMQSMVQTILDSGVAVAVYVSPSGGSATSAGVFITLAGHFAVMAPGTTIGAAHPVMVGGQDVTGDMRAKVENMAVSLIKAISQQRGRNLQWAEQAVRESVSITDQEAVEEKVVDFVAADLDRLLSELENRTVNVAGKPVTLAGVSRAPRVSLEMSFKQKVVNVLSDPNVAILLGLGAVLGLGMELYHPGGVVPGILGAICLVLSLTAGQVLPISIGGVALLVLGAGFFVVELFLPSFGIWGGAGVICLILGSIYFVDMDMVYGVDGFSVNRWFIGSVAALVGLLLLLLCYLVLKSSRRAVVTGREGLIGRSATVVSGFEAGVGTGPRSGKVRVMGEIWNARLCEGAVPPARGEEVEVVSLEEGMTLRVKRK